METAENGKQGTLHVRRGRVGDRAEWEAKDTESQTRETGRQFKRILGRHMGDKRSIGILGDMRDLMAGENERQLGESGRQGRLGDPGNKLGEKLNGRPGIWRQGRQGRQVSNGRQGKTGVTGRQERLEDRGDRRLGDEGDLKMGGLGNWGDW